MLSKNLLKFRRTGETIKPVFIDVEDAENLELAQQFLELYRLPENPKEALTRGELEELALPLLKGHRDLKFSGGLHKLTLDRCDFAAPRDLDYPELRQKLFTAGAMALRNELPEDVAFYRAELLKQCPDAGDGTGIYQDLPQNEKLCRSHRLFPKELLQRLNCGQVQSLLLYSSELNLRIEERNPATVRRLFKYLKFFRLLAEITQLPMTKKERRDGTLFRFEMQISGPASLFENTRKYALQLASFFPAVCDLTKWTLNAEIELDGRKSRLRLNQDAGLVGHYRNFSAYVPEEITMFHRLFREKSAEWQIVGESPFFNFGNQELIFPDLSFRSNDAEREIHLELFHRWHSTQLLRRLETMKANPETPLLVGVDRSLSRRPDIKAALDGSEFFQNKGFLFRDFPGVERVTKLLNSVS